MRLRHILSVLLLAVFALSSQAQGRKAVVSRLPMQGQTRQQVPLRVQGLSDNQRLLGYIRTDSITVSGGAFGKEGTYTLGAMLTPRVLSGYAGCRVVGVRLAAAVNLGRSRTFVYKVNDGSVDPVLEQTQRLYEGWQNVFFNGDGYEIQGSETLFFGFDYHETAEMVAAEEGGLCGYGDDSTDGFYAFGDFGQGLGFYSLSNLGRLCVQLIVDVSSLAAKDIDLQGLDAGFKYKQPGEDIDVMVTLGNVGREELRGFQLGWQIDDQPVEAVVKPDTLLSGEQSAALFTVTLPADITIGLHRLTVSVDKVGGEPMPEKSVNDTLVATFAVYRDKLQRSQVYLEVYTDQESAYVPFLNNALSQLKSSQVPLSVVNVHRPGTPLAVKEAAYLHLLYAYTWPTFTINRAYFPGEAYVSYDMNDYLPQVPTEFISGILSDMVYQDYYSPSFVSLTLEASYDTDSRQLTVKTEGQLLPEAAAIYGQLGVTLLLVEDEVKSKQLVYNSFLQRSTYNQNYQHNSVLRGYMTKPTGTALTQTGDTYSATFNKTLDEAWNPAKMRVVALITKYAETVSEDNLTDVDVVNAASFDLSTLESLGVVAPKTAVAAAAYYSLDGKAVSADNLKQGVYLMRQADGTTRKIVLK